MKEVIEELKVKKARLEEKVRELELKIVQLRRKEDLLRKVKRVISASLDTCSSRVQSFIEEAVTDGLKIVYGKSLEFRLEKVNTGGWPGFTFKLGKEGHFRSLLCYGGGIRSIISTILRFVIAHHLTKNMLFILDEVGSNISREYQSNFGVLLKTFSKKFNRQVILITHQAKVAELADCVISVDLENDKSIVNTGGLP